MNKAQRDAAVQAVGKEFGFVDLEHVIPSDANGILIWSLPGKTVGEQLGRIVDIAADAAAKAAPKPTKAPHKPAKRKAKRSR